MNYANKINIVWALVALCCWPIFYFNIFKKAELYIPSNYIKSRSKLYDILLFLVGVVGWILIGISLMGPRSSIGRDDSTIEVNDIYFAVDVSHSMLADDFNPNRLEVAKKKIEEFVDLRPKDRIGVVMFSEKAYTLLPLTTDMNLIKRVISDKIKIGFLGSGTNIGDALGLAVARISQTETKNKIVILLTDGVSNVGNLTPIQAAKKAKESGVKVYTIGIASSKNAKIPSGLRGAARRRMRTIPGGSADFSTLDEISEITGGKSFRASNENSLKSVFAEISDLEKTEIKSSGKIIYKEHYYKYLFAGSILLFISIWFRRYFLGIII